MSPRSAIDHGATIRCLLDRDYFFWRRRAEIITGQMRRDGRFFTGLIHGVLPHQYGQDVKEAATLLAAEMMLKYSRDESDNLDLFVQDFDFSGAAKEHLEFFV